MRLLGVPLAADLAAESIDTRSKWDTLGSLQVLSDSGHGGVEMSDRVVDRNLKRIKVKYGLEKPEHVAFSKNISPSGLRLWTNRVYHPGSRLRLRLDLPDGPVEAWARVVWAKKVPAILAQTSDCGMGLELEEAPPEWLAACAQLRK